MFKMILSFLLLFLLISCGKNEETILFPLKVKQLPNESTLESYLTSSLSTPDTTPDIYIFVVESLRGDYVNPYDMPNLWKLQQESLHTSISLSAATATPFSFFGIFNSRFGYERWPYIHTGRTKGAFPLMMLKQAGYHINLFGFPDYMFRITPAITASAAPPTEFTQMKMLFGENSYLLNGVAPDHAQNSTYGSNFAQMDQTVINNLKQNITDTTSDPNLFITYLYSAHHRPYYWLPTIPNPHVPNSQTYSPINSNNDYNTMNVLIEKNSYLNTLQHYDLLLGQFINHLKSKLPNQAAYKNSIIVVTGDHGKYMYELGETFHGKWTYKSVISVPIIYKLRDKDGSIFQSQVPKLGSQLDIFPTIFDYMGMTNYGQDYMVGESLLHKTLKSHIVVKPDWNNPCNMFALMNDQYKVYAEFIYDNQDIMTTKGFRIESIRDLDDNLIEIAPTAEQTKAKIEEDFHDILKKMFVL